jgi:hypothetical protein
MPIHPLLLKSKIQRSFLLSLMTLWVLSMAPTSHVPLQPPIVMCQGTARVRSHKTALPRVPSIFVSHIFYLVGKDLRMILRFSMTPVKLIFTSQMGSTTLQMLALHRQMCCLSLIETCGTICVNGKVPVIGNKFMIFSYYVSLTFFFFKSTQRQRVVQFTSHIGS